jgi:hypothetical protein
MSEKKTAAQSQPKSQAAQSQCPENLKKSFESLPTEKQDAVRECVGVGVPWQSALSLVLMLLDNAPLAADVIRQLLDQFGNQPMRAGHHHPDHDHIEQIEKNALCTLSCCLCLRHKEDEKPQPAV